MFIQDEIILLNVVFAFILSKIICNFLNVFSCPSASNFNHNISPFRKLFKKGDLLNLFALASLEFKTYATTIITFI